MLNIIDLNILTQVFSTQDYRNTVYMRNYYDGEKVNLKTSMVLHIFITPAFEKKKKVY
jgi:hypothetical protein